MSLGVVRQVQFVATPLGHEYTIEEQMTSRAEYDVIHIDIYPSLQNDIACESESGVELDITRSPHLTSSRVSPALSHQSRLSSPEVCCRILPFSRLTPSDVISSAYKEYGYP